MSRVTLRLTLDVTYEISDDAHPDTLTDLHANLMDMPHRAQRANWFTRAQDAAVVVFISDTERIK